MLVCFGSSWPFAIVRSLRSKSSAGKSIVFHSLVLAGYGFGITYKLMIQLDAVIWLYAINSAMVITEIALYYKFKNPTNSLPYVEVLECFCPSASGPTR